MRDLDRLLARWPATVNVWRTLGPTGEGLVAYGMMHKAGIRDDVVNRLWTHCYGVGYVLRGTGVFHDAAGGSWPLAPGSVFQRVPGQVHSTILDPESRWAECYVAVGPRLGRALIEAGMFDPRRPVIERGLDVALAERVLAETSRLRAASDARLPTLLAGALAMIDELVRRPAEAVDPDARLVAAACARLGEDLASPCSPRKLARELGCGYERFRKVFRLATGIGPDRWRMRRRIDWSRELLLDRTLTVAEVAKRAGFADPTLFATRFRAYTGVSPRRFRAGGG
jgi:AraC family transcriptional regulator, arabinose operon regulatory protein